MSSPVSGADHDRVRELLGREPRGRYEIVVRDAGGDPVVLRNSPLLDDGTPMPTRYWLVGSDEIKRIGRLEAAGGVDQAEAAVDDDELVAAHARYAAERDAALPAGHQGPTPTGGVGGTRIGVKCLHAHWAWHLAGGDDPVGRWIEARLHESPPSRYGQRKIGSGQVETASFEVGAEHCVVTVGADRHVIPWGFGNLTTEWLTHDPPRPDGLTNAFGSIADHLDDVLRLTPSALDVSTWVFHGPTITSLASLEAGRTVDEEELGLDRESGEEVFRIVATETASDRAHNPGLPSDHVDVIVATCCIVQGCMRHLHLNDVVLVIDRSGEST